MKIKHFFIRLNKENLINDETTLNNFLDNKVVKKIKTELILGIPNVWSILIFYEDQNAKTQDKSYHKILINDENELSNEEQKIYAVLKQWRQDKANAMNIPNYVVAHNTELMTIAKVKPQTIDELLKIKGFVRGGQKILKYGTEIIAVLNSI